MQHVLGIDLGKRKFTACVLTRTGEEAAAPREFDNNEGGVQQLLAYIGRACPELERARTVAAMESTSCYWVNLMGRLAAEGFVPALLNPLLVRGHSRASIRGRKTDEDNAADCAKVVLFEKVFTYHQPDEGLFELRQLCRFHEELSADTAELKNRTLTLMSRLFPEFETLFSDVFGKTAMAVLSRAASPEEILALDTAKLTRLISKASRNRLGAARSRSIKQAAATTFALPFAASVLSIEVRHLVQIIKVHEDHLKELEKEISKRYMELGLMLHTIPGVGVYNAAVIASEYGDISRFGTVDTASKMVAFAGVDAVVQESEGNEKKRYMSKKGSTYLRCALYRAAQVAACHDPMFKAVLEKHKAKHYKVALSHVMNKMVHVVYSVLRTGQPYQPRLM